MEPQLPIARTADHSPRWSALPHPAHTLTPISRDQMQSCPLRLGPRPAQGGCNEEQEGHLRPGP